MDRAVIEDLRGFVAGADMLSEDSQRPDNIDNKMSAAHNAAAAHMNNAFGNLKGGTMAGGWAAHATLKVPAGGHVTFSIGSQWQPKPGAALLYINVEDPVFNKEGHLPAVVRDCGKIIAQMLPKYLGKYGKKEWGGKVSMGRDRGTRVQLAFLIDNGKEEQALKALQKAAVAIGKQCARLVEKGAYGESVRPAMYELLERKRGAAGTAKGIVHKVMSQERAKDALLKVGIEIRTGRGPKGGVAAYVQGKTYNVKEILKKYGFAFKKSGSLAYWYNPNGVKLDYSGLYHELVKSSKMGEEEKPSIASRMQALIGEAEGEIVGGLEQAEIASKASKNPAEWPRIFDKLKSKQIIYIAMSSVMGMSRASSGEYYPHKVGRRSKARKPRWWSEAITLEPADGSKAGRFAKFKLWKSKDGSKVSMSHGDMAVMLKGIYVP